MKNLMKFGFFALISSMLFLTSCGDDPDPIIETGPSATISSAALEYENQTFKPGTILGPIEVTFKKGSFDLNTVQVNKNGEKLVAGWDLADSEGNPLNFDPTQTIKMTEDQKSEATLYFILDLSDEETTDNYKWLVSDVEFNVDSTEALSLETKIEGTPVQEFTGYLLSNAGGPPGQGGLDLDTGDQTGSDSDDAEIADAGIDINEPDTDNWIQKFFGVKGSEIMPLPAAFDYDGVVVKEQIADSFLESEVLADKTDVVEVGDMFIVKNSDKYFLLKVEEVNITNEARDNSDHYKFLVKK